MAKLAGNIAMTGNRFTVQNDTAANAGMIPVGVLWGFRTEDELREHGARVLLHSPGDLLQKVTFSI